MTKKASIRSLSSMARSLARQAAAARDQAGASRLHLAGKPCGGAAARRDSHHVQFLRHARAVANEGIEAAFRGILARHGRPEAVRAPLIHAFHAEGRRPPDTPLWKHRLAAISNTDDDLIAGGLPFTEVSDVAEAARPHLSSAWCQPVTSTPAATWRPAR